MTQIETDNFAGLCVGFFIHSNMAELKESPVIIDNKSTSKRQLSTSSTESTKSTKLPVKRQRQRSLLSNNSVADDVLDEVDDDIEEDYSSAEDEPSDAPCPRPTDPAPIDSRPTAKVNWLELLDVMAVAFNDTECSFTKGLTQVIDRSDKLNLAHERLNTLESKVAEQDQRIYALDNEIISLKKRIDSKDEIIDDIKVEMDEMKSKLKTVVDKQTSLDSENIPCRLDELDQYGRRNMLRLSGVAETNDDDENTQQLVIDIFKAKLKVDTQHSDIDRVHRLGALDKSAKNPRSIVVKFATYNARHAVYSARKKLYKTGLYLNDHLTTTRARLMFVARLYKKHNLVKNVWSSDGRVLVRVDDTTHAITNESDLLRFDPANVVVIPPVSTSRKKQAVAP